MVAQPINQYEQRG